MADLAKKKEKKIVVPVKPTINLYTPVKLVDPGKLAIILVIIVAIGLVGAKFGVLDPLAKQTEAQTNVSNKQAQYAALNAKIAASKELEDKYGRYSFGWMDEKEASIYAREEVFKTIEDYMKDKCVIENASLSNNTLSMSIRGVTLDEAREIVKVLREQEHVQSAIVYSAVATDETQVAKISMTVVFVKEVAAE